MDVNQVLRRISAVLESNQIPYMIVGSFASSFHGALRSTADVDIVIDADLQQLQKLTDYLRGAQYYVVAEDAFEALRQRSMFNIIDLTVSWKIDFIFIKPRAFSREEFRRRVPVDYESIPLFIASKEDTVISKLEWAKLAKSARQLDDSAILLRKNWKSLDHPYLAKWINELGLTSQWDDARRQAGIE
jgi:hypothetical protein